MPTRNVNLTGELDSFVLAKVKSGRCENASEVVRAALRTLGREAQRYEAKLAALRTASDTLATLALRRWAGCGTHASGASGQTAYPP